MSEIIYEKHYPHKSFEEEMKEMEEYCSKMGKDESVVDLQPSFEEFYKDMIENRTLILLPEKANRAQDFIDLAIKTGKFYELDTIIRKADSHITASYSFDSGGDMMILLPILREADNIAFFAGIRGYEITMSIDFYTHAVFHHGRLVYPADIDLEI